MVFKGFPAGKVRFTRLPGPFFSELLPQIDNLNELKVVLYAFWQLDRREGEQRYLQLEDFSEDALFMAGPPPAPYVSPSSWPRRSTPRGWAWRRWGVWPGWARPCR